MKSLTMASIHTGGGAMVAAIAWRQIRKGRFYHWLGSLLVHEGFAAKDSIDMIITMVYVDIVSHNEIIITIWH